MLITPAVNIVEGILLFNCSHLLAGTRNMPSQTGERAKGVQMTEQQPKTPQIIDIVEMPPTADIVQIPATQDMISFVTSYLNGQSFCVSIGQSFIKWRFLIGSFSSILIGGISYRYQQPKISYRVHRHKTAHIRPIPHK
jgi:hypothetical protein